MMKVFKLIGFRIFAMAMVLLLLLSFLQTYKHLNTQEKNLQTFLETCGNRVVGLVRASTHNSMLNNMKENSYKIFDNITDQEGIENIRIISKDGNVVYSKFKDQIGMHFSQDDEACTICHTTSDENIYTTDFENKIRIYEKNGSRHLIVAAAIKNEKSCYDAGCHYHDPQQKVIASLDVTLSLSEMDALLKAEEDEMMFVNILITFILAVAAGIFLWVFVHIPVRKLTEATRQISRGNLNHKIHLKSNDEIHQLAESFNKMIDDLNEAQNEITAWSNELENRVNLKTKELEKTQERILQIEKMASLGKLSATVAHELNNPLSGILTYSKLITKKLKKENTSDEEKEKIFKQLSMIESESERCGTIIKNLLIFSKEKHTEKKENDLNQTVENSLQLVGHHLHLHNIALESSYDKNLPKILMDVDQIKQALLAIYFNAVEAMDNEGKLIVKTEFSKIRNMGIIKVTDNGKGMSEEVKKRIFEPFFTTKNQVKGVGLGLSIVYGIIEKHQGEILVESEPGKGTTFKIYLPVE